MDPGYPTTAADCFLFFLGQYCDKAVYFQVLEIKFDFLLFHSYLQNPEWFVGDELYAYDHVVSKTKLETTLLL